MNRNEIKQKIDSSYSKKIMRELSQFTDCPSIGGRASGSPAEHRAADYLVRQFQAAGLEHVTKDPFPADTWTLKEAKLTYKGLDGKISDVLLGGHACNLQCREKEFPIIFGGKGTEKDYDSVDPLGKLVLIEINQAQEWWVNFPAYEAKIRGAAGIICMNTGGFGQEGEHVLVSQDLCGPSDMIAFSIGKKDGQDLKKQIEKNVHKEITVSLTVDSCVTEEGISYNVWGDIPGTTEDVIYVINHYDSYFYTVFDDVQGIGWALGLAKAFTDAGYKPKKTIRFVAHGAEEWGMIDCKHDWATGAYQQITNIRPQWKDTGFAVINLDGFYAVKGESKFCIVCTQELYDFVSKAVEKFGNTGDYQIEVNTNLTCSTEDFSYTRAGIPSFVAGAYDGCIADKKVLHSSNSSWDAGFDDKAFELFHHMFAHIIMELDEKNICPINLQRRLSLAFQSMDKKLEEKEVFHKAIKSAQRLNRNIQKANKEGFCQFDEAKINRINKSLREIYRELHHCFIRLDWNDQMIIPHERYAANKKALLKAQKAVKTAHYREAAEFLMEIDFNYYGAFFSQRTCEYFEQQVTGSPKESWGTGLIEHGNENLFLLIRSLFSERYGKKEKDRMERAVNKQNHYWKQAVIKEIDAARKLGTKIEELNKEF